MLVLVVPNLKLWELFQVQKNSAKPCSTSEDFEQSLGVCFQLCFGTK